jgi:DNA-binding NtrC family response regulator
VPCKEAMTMPPDRQNAFGVLVVDDELEIRELLTDFFHQRSLSVTSAADGRAAILAIERAPSQFGLVLTDLKLPGCDGLEVLARARRVNPSMAVVIITGYSSLDSAIQAVRLGAYDYLTKPFALGQLEILLKRVTDRFALESENRHLARLADRRDSTDGSMSAVRYDALERRLDRLEALLREFATRQ